MSPKLSAYEMCSMCSRCPMIVWAMRVTIQRLNKGISTPLLHTGLCLRWVNAVLGCLCEEGAVPLVSTTGWNVLFRYSVLPGLFVIFPSYIIHREGAWVKPSLRGRITVCSPPIVVWKILRHIYTPEIWVRKFQVENDVPITLDLILLVLQHCCAFPRQKSSFANAEQDTRCSPLSPCTAWFLIPLYSNNPFNNDINNTHSLVYMPLRPDVVEHRATKLRVNILLRLVITSEPRP